MADLEVSIQQAEAGIAQMQTVLDRIQYGLRKAEGAVHSSKKAAPVLMAVLAISVAVSAALIATWIARRARRWLPSE
jgi:hypothetical protein